MGEMNQALSLNSPARRRCHDTELEVVMAFRGHRYPAMPLGYLAVQAATFALGVKRAQDKTTAFRAVKAVSARTCALNAGNTACSTN